MHQLGSSIVIYIPVYCGMLIMGEAVHVLGQGYMKLSVLFTLFFCELKAKLHWNVLLGETVY